MGHNIFGWDLPPGCKLSDIPGNRPEDEKWEAITEGFWNGKHCSDELWGKFAKAQLDGDLVDVVDKAIEYGIDIGQKEATEIANENKYYEQSYAEERMNKKIYPETDTQNDWTSLENCDHEELPSYWNDIDIKVANQTMCPKCGRPMAYRGFWDKERKRFKCAFAVCYHDNFAIEF